MKMRYRSFLSSFALTSIVFGTLSAWAVESRAQDRVEPTSRLPGFEPRDLPQFVAMSFDDNFEPEGVDWATDFFATRTNGVGAGVAVNQDGAPARITYFHNGTYVDGARDAWRRAVEAGFEVANHTFDHPDGRYDGYSAEQWETEIRDCENALVDADTGIGVTAADIVGFRTPFLAYNDATFTAVANWGLEYDSTIQACWGAQEDGSNCLFPYTLDNGSPDNAALRTQFGEPLVSSHPGLWELPVSTLIVPPDSLATKYGFTPGLRERIPTDMAGTSYYDPETGKLAPLDITLFLDAGMTPAEVLATLKHTFDLRVAGNRAPFVFVLHTHVYVQDWDGNTAGSTAEERRQAIEDFVDYTLENSATRVVAVEDILGWMRAPRSLDGKPADPNLGTGGSSSSGGSSSAGGNSGTGSSSTGGADGGDGADDGGEEAGGCAYASSPSSSSRSLGGLFGVVALGVATVLSRRARRPA